MTTETLMSVLAALPLPTVLIGPGARIRAANHAAQVIFGPVMEERHHETVLRQPVLVGLVAAIRSGLSRQEARFVATGTERESIYRVNAARVDFPEGAGVLLTFEDMSPLEQAGEMRRDFVANVSHELRSPLTAMLGFIETLQGAARDDPAARDRFLTIMQREANRMNRLVSDLLHLSRVESEERVRPTQRVDVTSILENCVATLRPMAMENGVTLELSGGGTAIEAPADADQLTQAFTNLIENAVKYGGSGRPVDIQITRLDMDPALRGPAVEINVRDHGDGIEAVHIPRLTERFYRVDNHRSREKGGTGLGLAIVKHIVNRHRGRMRIESTPGEGSLFSLRLPAI